MTNQITIIVTLPGATDGAAWDQPDAEALAEHLTKMVVGAIVVGELVMMFTNFKGIKAVGRLIADFAVIKGL